MPRATSSEDRVENSLNILSQVAICFETTNIAKKLDTSESIKNAERERKWAHMNNETRPQTSIESSKREYACENTSYRSASEYLTVLDLYESADTAECTHSGVRYISHRREWGLSMPCRAYDPMDEHKKLNYRKEQKNRSDTHDTRASRSRQLVWRSIPRTH